jgi:cytochrome d ubiquinol oxidase subunit II
MAWTRWGLLWVALGVAAVSVATPLVSQTVQMKWFEFPRMVGLMLLPLATLLAWIGVWRSTGRLSRGEAGVAQWAPFADAVTIFVLAFIGLAYSLFPYVVIDRLTFWDAAAHPSSLKVVLVGALIVLPFIVAYTAFSYYVFRGKARPGLYD